MARDFAICCLPPGLPHKPSKSLGGSPIPGSPVFPQA